MRFLTIACFFAFAVAACDSTVDGPPTNDPPGTDVPPAEDTRPRVPTSEDEVLLDDRAFALRLGHDLAVSGGAYPAGSSSVTMAGGGLWLAGRQDGQTRAAIQRYGNWSFGPCEGDSSRVYAVDADTTYSPEGWPADVGAPTHEDGTPRAYGDRMAWTSACTRDSDSLPGPTLAGLRVNTALFGDESPSNLLYIRYEIRNETGSAVTDAYAGFWADSDLAGEEFNIFDNLVGLDLEDRLSYVYVSGTRQNEEAVPASSRGYVAGHAVLESPGNAPLASHRIVTKRGEPYHDGRFTSTEDIAFALRGLSNDGDPMIDPTTGEPSPFAYTGDPVAMTGWLDGYETCDDQCIEGAQVGSDVRHLLAVGPFSLGAGETTVFTVAYGYQTGNSLAEGLDRLRGTIETVRSRPERWRFAAE